MSSLQFFVISFKETRAPIDKHYPVPVALFLVWKTPIGFDIWL